jgi:hypothetical protein
MSPEVGEPDERISHPNRGTLGPPPYGGGGHLNLSAEQLHGHENEPSWQAPREGRGLGATAWIAIAVVVGVALVAVLWATGAI